MPEVRGLAKDLRKAARCGGGIVPKRWVFRNSKIPERLSSLEGRVAELGGAGNSSSLCSIDADRASAPCAWAIDRGWVRTNSIKWVVMSRRSIVRCPDREVGDKEDRISGRETDLEDVWTRRVVQQNARMFTAWRTLNMWSYGARGRGEDYRTGTGVVEQLFSPVAETSVFVLSLH